MMRRVNPMREMSASPTVLQPTVLHPTSVMPTLVMPTFFLPAVWLLVLVLMLASGGVRAQSSQCGFITDPDRQA